MAYQHQLRRGIASLWTSVNPVLADGIQGYETDTGKMKIGDGVTAWTSLAYWYNPATVSTQSFATTEAIVYAIALGG